MQINKLEFPTYEYLKSLDFGTEDEPNEYEFIIFDIFGLTYVRFKLNEDGNGKLYVDLIQDGYTTIGNSKLFKFTNKEYKKACRYCQDLFEETIYNILDSNSMHKGYWL